MLEPTPLYGGNADFLDALYEQYLRDPASVDERWRTYFDRLAPPRAGERPHGPVQAGIAERGCMTSAAHQPAVSRLIQIWTNRGHLLAKVDPLGLMQRPRPRVLDVDY